MKKYALLLAISFALMTHFAAAKDSAWKDDYNKALASAKSDKKMVLLDFTGSDWCSWCMKLDKEVFSTSKFKEYAKNKLVLVELDFPHKKHQSKAVKAQNEKLSDQYKIEGYPTVIVLNSGGKPVGKLGYMEGGPDAFIAELEKLKGK